MKIAAVLIFLCALTPLYAQEGEYEADLEKQLYKSLNQERERRGIPPLKWNDKLRDSARSHTDRLAETQILSHQFKDEPPLLQRIAATGLNFYLSAENVALATDWPDIHTGLMQSEGHRHNILNPNYTDIGIGVRKRGGTYYVTQNFARTTQLLQANDAEEKIADLIRKDRRFGRRIKVTSSAALREAACDMAKDDQLNARNIPTNTGDHGVLAFTSSALDELPPAMDQVASRNAGRVNIGSCFKATATYPGGTYWFAVVY
jgi:hypothetical protein